jgi:1-deoxy-D-xylulose-5-phosphate reductoisomerase
MKGIAIIGSTGSIGTQALDVVRAHPDQFSVQVLTANSNAQMLIQQAIEFMPTAVVIVAENQYQFVKESLAHLPIEVFSGSTALLHVVTYPSIHIVLTATVGFSGLEPTIAAIKAGKDIALANKETLVVAGHIVMPLAAKHGVRIIPVDSEHSAIYQCLVGEELNPIESIILTASGGPFRGFTKQQLEVVTPQQALKHPNWSMGNKITIDSATLMNKGLEVIEARWLFDVPSAHIQVVVHPQSIVHSMVVFQDGSVKAQLGLPDMKLPIQYALAFPTRLSNTFPRADFAALSTLTFLAPDYSNFPCLNLAFTVLEIGGSAPCILNAANEIAVTRFLSGQISFTDIPRLIHYCINGIPHSPSPNVEQLVAIDHSTRQLASVWNSII